MFSGHGGGESYLPLPEISEDLGEPAVTKFGQDRHLSLGGGRGQFAPLIVRRVKDRKVETQSISQNLTFW